MSDGILDKHTSAPQESDLASDLSSDLPTNPPVDSSFDSFDSKEKKPQTRRSLLGSLNNDLKQALDTWDILTEEMATKLSPEEEQLSEVKRLLGELKSKLSQFED